MQRSVVASIFVGILAVPLLFAGVNGIELGLIANLEPESRGLNLLVGVPMLPIGFGLFMVANHLWSPQRAWRGSAAVTLAVTMIAAGLGLVGDFMPQPLPLAGRGLMVAGAIAVYLLARRAPWRERHRLKPWHAVLIAVLAVLAVLSFFPGIAYYEGWALDLLLVASPLLLLGLGIWWFRRRQRRA